jgi:D-sedoheptulose 7-phosphate isomerase
MSSHVSVDLTKMCTIRAVNLNEADLLTCFSNDYGYENRVQKALYFYADKGDLLICISSSGQSKNIINGAKFAKKIGCKVVTLTGFDNKNKVRKIGHINLWLNSKNYNLIEMTHHIWLLSIVDFIAKAKF